LAVNRSNQILIIVMIASFLTPFCGSSLNMSLPDIGREFHAGTSELSWVIETFLLTCAIFTVPMGQLGNRIGKKKVVFNRHHIIYIELVGYPFCADYSLAHGFARAAGNCGSYAVLYGDRNYCLSVSAGTARLGYGYECSSSVYRLGGGTGYRRVF